MTETEKKLLRQQAEAYAFIHDLRAIALTLSDLRYVRLTEGIDTTIKRRQEEYPVVFKRYFNEALKKAEAAKIKSASISMGPVRENGKRETISEREKESTQKQEARGSGGEKRTPLESLGKETQKKQKQKKRLPTAGAKRKPE